MKNKKGSNYNITIDVDLLKMFPQLSTLPASIDPASYHDFVTAVESRSEGMKVELSRGIVRIKSKSPIRRNRFDFLGLEIPDPKLNEICEVIRDDTGRDPRRDIVYAKRGSILGDLPESARVHIRNGLPRPQVKSHPLNPISDEELVTRRELSESRWTRSKRYNTKIQDTRKTEIEEKSNEVKKFFFRKKRNDS
jgi:hypothetical protein